MKNPLIPIIAAVIGFSAGYVIKEIQEKPKTVQETYAVSRIIDGDTIDLKDGITVSLNRIRLLGIDTPERGEFFYKEAGKKLEELIAGREVLLERDCDDMDKYGRALRYIIVDNKTLNIEMIRLGYAKAYMFKGLKYENEILEAEKEAKAGKKGIWCR